MSLPRIVHGACPVPGDWLTPPEKANTYLKPNEVRAYVNGRIVEWAEVVYLDPMPADNGETVPPHVSAMLPDGPPQYVIDGGRVVARQPRRPVDIFGDVEVRREPPPSALRDELDEVYVEEYGWHIAPDGRRLKPRRPNPRTDTSN